MIWSDNSHVTGVDNWLTGQAPTLPTVLSKGYTFKNKYTDNFCIYIHAVTSPLVLPFNVRPIFVTCQFVICFVPFSYVAFLFYPLLLCFSYGETTPFTIRLVRSAYDVKGRNSYETPTHFVDLRDVRVMLWVIFSLQERWPPHFLSSSVAHRLQYLPCVFRQFYRQ